MYGKGGKERVVYLDDIAMMYLICYLSERRDKNQALFINKRKKRFLPSGVREMLRKVGKRAGVENVHPHRFRRTLATN